MVKVAYIFPGQGAQFVGMGKGLYDNFTQAREVFDEADGVLDFGLKALSFEGPADELARTGYSQPAILTASIAALRSLNSQFRHLHAKAALGLSLGEYSALISAGSINFADGVKLVRARGYLMEEASKSNPGKMASVLGLEMGIVEEVCRDAGCEIANLNSPGQVVISGREEAVEKAMCMAKERGALRSVILDVSGPFHSSLMKNAAERFRGVLEKVDIKRPAFGVVSNVDASYETDVHAIKKNLLAQLTSRTYWEDSIRMLARDGIDTFLEIGPGRILKGLLRRIDPKLKVYNVGTKEDIDNLRGLL